MARTNKKIPFSKTLTKNERFNIPPTSWEGHQDHEGEERRTQAGTTPALASKSSSDLTHPTGGGHHEKGAKAFGIPTTEGGIGKRSKRPRSNGKKKKKK